LSKIKVIDWQSPLEKLFSSRKTKACQSLLQAGLTRVEDLIWFFPKSIQEIPKLSSFSNAKEDQLFKGIGTIKSISSQKNFYRKRSYKSSLLVNISVTIEDLLPKSEDLGGTEDILHLKWFNCYSSFLKKIKKGDKITFWGKVTLFNNQLQIVNPIIDSSENDSSSTTYFTEYPSINGTTGKETKKVIQRIPSSLWEALPENLPSSIVKKKKLLSRGQAFRMAHAINSNCLREHNHQYPKALYRIIYEEFFNEQIKILTLKNQSKVVEAPIIGLNSEKINQLKSLFPFSLTSDQEKVVNEILIDLKVGHTMERLIQGDVGSGKTAVSFLAAMIVISNKFQVILMAPTESLARQHFDSFKKLNASLEVSSALLLGSTSPKDKKIIYDELKDGSIDFIFGTHALLQDHVGAKKCALVIIDEQHKFGVDQREKLTRKASNAHKLYMSATPIPRSLRLTQFGKLDISSIKSYPSNRKGTKTRIITPQNMEKFLSFVKTRLSLGEQGYIVLPAIEESDKTSFLSVDKTHELFKKFFPHFSIEKIHGKLKTDLKKNILGRFQQKDIDLLISTSLIEVGIDNPNATIMAIINPERFGLSSLHQLRGRVGRGGLPGFCFLVTGGNISKTAYSRIKVIEKSNDGFFIAEEDLKIRGEGDIFGVEQSGIITERKMADLVKHQDILFEATKDAKEFLRATFPLV
jgi:ATP-dependent DNA helicase RecG